MEESNRQRLERIMAERRAERERRAALVPDEKEELTINISGQAAGYAMWDDPSYWLEIIEDREDYKAARDAFFSSRWIRTGAKYSTRGYHRVTAPRHVWRVLLQDMIHHAGYDAPKGCAVAVDRMEIAIRDADGSERAEMKAEAAAKRAAAKERRKKYGPRIPKRNRYLEEMLNSFFFPRS